MNKTLLFTLGGILLIGIVGYAVFARNNGVEEGNEITVTGSVICLPHLDTSGPQTLECALGLQTAEGTNYALEFLPEAGVDFSDIRTGITIGVTGTLTPRAMLSPENRLTIYDIEGLLTVSEVDLPGNGEGDQHVVEGGALSFERPEDFGLAISAEQVLVESVIPPCSEGFDYCLYYNSDEFSDTNFESAGLRIENRTDIADETACLTTPPAGYTNLEPQTSRSDTYSVSVFSPVQNAAAGHASEGTIYRLAFDSSCFEFETRIGTSQFANYEPGTIEEFTEADRQQLENRLREVLETVAFTDGREGPIFP